MLVTPTTAEIGQEMRTLEFDPVGPIRTSWGDLRQQVPAYFTHQQLINAFFRARAPPTTKTTVGSTSSGRACANGSPPSARRLEGQLWDQLTGLSDIFRTHLVLALTELLGAAPTAPPRLQPGAFTTQGTQLHHQGRPFRFVGVNLPELAYVWLSAPAQYPARQQHPH
ncbi:MAG: hypothetical protein HC915_04470 [Anaerolineae bacterium]|nr:hypothetical protein [Anaerolineae bacterium]